MLAAVARGFDRWHELPPIVWAHLLSIIAALALTPLLLWNPKGTPRHRSLGKFWVALMLATATLSLFFNAGSGRPGSLGVFSLDVSPIHAISIFVLIMVPRAVAAARRRDITRHRRAIRGLVIGALITAGLFTLPFGRAMGRWLLA